MAFFDSSDGGPVLDLEDLPEEKRDLQDIDEVPVLRDINIY